MVIQQWNPGDAAAVVLDLDPTPCRPGRGLGSNGPQGPATLDGYGTTEYIPIALFKTLGIKGIKWNKYI